jgi:hypothetical protein
MNDMTEAPARGIGDNRPPATLIEELQERYKSLLDQVAEVKDAAETVPDEITSEDVQTRVAELIKKMRFVEKTLDGARELEREPHAKKVTEVNGFFKTRIDPLETLRKKLNERSQAFLEKKAAAERRRLAEEEERRREKAAADLAAAQEAERKKREAEEAQRKAEEETRRAQEARERAIREQQEAEERAAKAKVEEARLKAEALARAAEEARRAKEQQERNEKEQAERAAQKQRDDEAMVIAKANREKEEAAAAAAKAEAAKALEERRNAEEATRIAKADVKTAGRDEKEAMDSALREEKRADRIAEKVEGPEADLARTRSEHGAVSTLGRRWTSRVVNRDHLDMRKLWPFITGDAIEAALWKWMMAQAPEARSMPGAGMEIETSAQVR